MDSQVHAEGSPFLRIAGVADLRGPSFVAALFTGLIAFQALGFLLNRVPINLSGVGKLGDIAQP